jgi:hypothetical protein
LSGSVEFDDLALTGRDGDSICSFLQRAVAVHAPLRLEALGDGMWSPGTILSRFL